jgi:hypothetical protein
VEPETLDSTNLNRYALGRRSRLGDAKSDILSSFATEEISIMSVRDRLDESTAASLRPFEDRILVAVDDIPSRWLAQREAMRSWVSIGATSHDYVLMSGHPAGRPCAGCTHPRNESAIGTIPTISCVSFWAGLMQTLALLSADQNGDAYGTHVWPLGLDNPRGIQRYYQTAVAACPVGCGPSRLLRPPAP